MSAIKQRSEQGLPIRALDAVVYVFGLALTLFTIVYAATLVFGWPSVLEGLIGQPGWVTRVEQYMIVFFGLGVALYYLDYVTSQFDGTTGYDGTIDDVGTEPSSPNAKSAGGLERLHRAYEKIDPFIAVALAVTAISASAYVYLNFTRLQGDAYVLGYTTTDHVVGGILIALAIDVTRSVRDGHRGRRRPINTVRPLAGRQPVVRGVPSLGNELGADRRKRCNRYQRRLRRYPHADRFDVGRDLHHVRGDREGLRLMDFVREIGQELGTSLRTGVVQIAVISSMIMGRSPGVRRQTPRRPGASRSR